MTSPRLEIHPSRITENTRVIVDACARNGADVAGVVKVTCAHPAVVDAMLAGGVTSIADSRIDNLRRVRTQHPDVATMLLRIPEPSRVDEVIEVADLSLNSEPETMRLLSDAAVRSRLRHQVIVMVDLGDLREGVWVDRAAQVVTDAARLPGLDVVGVGCNLACYGGVIPDSENMATLVAVREACREASGLPLETLCGGNSANLPLLLAGGLPHEVNLLRIGESIILGRNVLDRTPLSGTRQDTVELVTEVVEVASKPSVPLGRRGQNAFGEETSFVDRGVRRRAICNVGRQDVAIDGLTPADPGIIVLGGSSDHLLLDVEDAVEPVHVGSELRFSPNYSALLAVSTSPYVAKTVIDDAPASGVWSAMDWAVEPRRPALRPGNPVYAASR